MSEKKKYSLDSQIIKRLKYEAAASGKDVATVLDDILSDYFEKHSLSIIEQLKKIEQMKNPKK